MNYDTAGNKIYEPIQNCDCGLTRGCKNCNPLSFRVGRLESFIGMINDEEAPDTVDDKPAIVLNVEDQAPFEKYFGR